MQDTLLKLKGNRLLELTEQDYENINNNSELEAIFLSKVKEGQSFNVTDSAVPVQELFKSDYFEYVLDMLMEQDFDTLLDVVCANEETLKEELPENTIPIAISYTTKHLSHIIDALKNKEQAYHRITNPLIIKSILDNKIEHQYGSIKLDPPTKEFESILLDALNRNTYLYIFTVTKPIIEKSRQTNNLAAAIFGIENEDEETEEIIFSALEEGSIIYDKLSPRFKDKHQNNPRLIKYQIRSSSYCYLNKEQLDNPEIRNIVIDEIKRNPSIIENSNIIYNINDYPDLVIACLTYGTPDTLKRIINNPSYISDILETHENEIINAIIENLMQNVGNIEEIFNAIINTTSYNNSIKNYLIKNRTFLNFVIPRLPLETIINGLRVPLNNTYGNYTYGFNEETKEILSTIPISVSQLPENFDFKIDYPKSIWLAIIPILSFEDLNPENIDLNRFIDYPEILDAIFLRLKELKSNRFNSALERFVGTKTETMIDIICSPENSLNISSAERIKIIPSSKFINSPYLYDIIKNSENIDNESFKTVSDVIINTEDVNEASKLISALFDPTRLKLDNTILSIILSTVTEIQKKETKTASQLAYLEALKNFIEEQKEFPIPLRISSLFGEVTIAKTTYTNTDKLASDPDHFALNTIRPPEHFINFLKKCEKSNLPIDLRILNSLPLTHRTELLNYNNIAFANDKDTLDIINSYLFKESSEYTAIVDKWISKIDYNFFDCQAAKFNESLIRNLIKHPRYQNRILDIISNFPDNTNIVLTSKILTFLSLTNISDELKAKINTIISKLIKKNAIAQITSYSDEEKLLIKNVTNPSFITYIKEKFIPTISTALTALTALNDLLDNPIYKEAALNELYKNYDLATNEQVISCMYKHREVKDYIIDFLKNDTNKQLPFNAKYFDIELLNAFLKNHKVSKIITYIVHLNTQPDISDEVNNIIKEAFFKEHPEYNKKSYAILESMYGMDVLRLLETDNVLNLLKEPPETLLKFKEIFKHRPLDTGIITSINDSFRQHEFNHSNSSIINFYTDTLEKIQRGITPKEIDNIVSTLLPYIPKKLEEEIAATNNDYLLSLYKTNLEEFIRELLAELGSNQNIYARLFNKITNNLIVQKRNEHRLNQDIYENTNLSYEYETKSLYNALFNYFVKYNPDELNDILSKCNQNNDLNYKTLCFLVNGEQAVPKEELSSIKKNIPVLKKIAFAYFDTLNEEDKERKASPYSLSKVNKKYSNLPYDYEYLLNKPEFTSMNIKKIPIIPPGLTAGKVMSNINFETFYSLIKDDEKYSALISILNKYRFLDWSNLFDPSIKRLSVGNDDINLFNFINAFSKIYDNEKKIILRERKHLMDIVIEEMRQSGKSEEEIASYISSKESEPINIQITAFKVLKYSTIFSSIANYYKVILGIEDFEYIRKNDGPNTAIKGSQEARLEKTTQMQLQMFELNKVTIPSFIHEYQADKKRRIDIIVGNRADSRNLTHGERTGACMRAYGHADDLFEFCNTDSRGFHITFVDSKTNEYISRVSGFRNGNTVFLNQLRNSTNSNYSTEDVIEACKKVAQELIDRSKDSKMPIENVVASPCYALDSYETEQLSETNIGKDVYTGYKDVSYNAVILATTGLNNKPVPVKLDATHQPIYEPTRLKPISYTQDKINDSVKISTQRISAIKACLENKSNPEYYKTINIDYETLEQEYLYIVLGQDWYVSLDTNGEIRYDIAVQSEKALAELQEALDKVNKLKEEQIRIGGFKNGL